MPSLSFQQLNEGWNAEPNAPDPKVCVNGSRVQLRFFLNPFAYEAADEEVGCLTFEDCSNWRFGPTNDEGWYLGQCRYSKLAPAWGEFYELIGDDNLRIKPLDWQPVEKAGVGSRHFLFYLRDETFECLAANWTFERRI
jgi:hypothetical protein